MAKSSSKAKNIPSRSLSLKTSRVPRSLRFSFRQTVSGLLMLSIIMLGVSGWFWWHKVFTDPDRLLSDMLGHSLQTSSVTRNVSQQDQQSLLDQSVRLNLSPSPTAQTITSLAQKEEGGISVVVTETLGTKQDDFVRYKSIESSSSQLDKKILPTVLNVWSKRENTGQPAAFLNEAMLGIVPFGNLKNEDRKVVLNILKDKKAYTYTQTNKLNQNGRQVLVYDMKVTPQALVEALAAYSQRSGLGEQSQLDPKAYADVPPINLLMTIDVVSRQLVSIKYVDSNRLELYQSQGLREKISLPSQSIAFQELQKRVQGLQPRQ